MAGIDEAGTEAGDIVDRETRRVGCRRNGDVHVRGTAEIIVGNVDVFSTDDAWLWADKQPRLIGEVYARAVGTYSDTIQV